MKPLTSPKNITADTPELRRPKLPSGLTQASALGTIALIGHGLGFFLLPAIAARLAWDSSGPWYVNALLLIVAVPLSGHGLHALGFLGHEGLHFNLHKNRRISAYIGVIFSSITPGHMEMGFAISHWNHHRFTNQDRDPDKEIFSQYKNFWSRLFSARLAATHTHFLDTLRLATGRSLSFDYKFPLGPAEVKRLARVNVFASISFLSLYIAVTIADPLTGLICIVLPALSASLMSGLRPYLEHAGTDDDEFLCARTRSAPYFTVLYMGNNYHLEHHLYPNVPCYRLPKVHLFLKEQGLLENAHIETGVIGAYGHALSSSQYAQPQHLVDKAVS